MSSIANKIEKMNLRTKLAYLLVMVLLFTIPFTGLVLESMNMIVRICGVEIIKIVLPFILVSLVAVFTINFTKKKSKSDDKNQKEDNYMYEGMIIGMCYKK